MTADPRTLDLVVIADDGVFRKIAIPEGTPLYGNLVALLEAMTPTERTFRIVNAEVIRDDDE
jgi:hypothetical protein